MLYLKFTQNPLRRRFVPYKKLLRELYLGILIFIKYFNSSVTINVLKTRLVKLTYKLWSVHIKFY